MYESVLIVDDSKEIRENLREYLLEPKGFKVYTASNGQMGFEMAMAYKLDLMIIDQQMPRLTGLEMLVKLIESGVHIPTILATAHGSEETAVDAFRLGVRDYIIKPFDFDEMAEAVERALRESRLQRERDQLVHDLMENNTQLQQRAAELNVLYGVGRSISSSLNIEEVLYRIVEAALYVVGAEECLLALLDADTNELYVRASKNLDPERYPVGKPIDDELAREVVETRKAVGIGENFLKERTLITKQIKSLIYVPLIVNEDVIGVLGVINRRKENSFDKNDVRTLSTLATYAVIAINNANMYANIEREVEERTQAWQQAQNEARAAEKLATIGQIGAEFAHRMNNLAGTIPVRIKLAKDHLDLDDPKNQPIIKQLDQISGETHQLLQAAKAIKLSTESQAAELVQINELLESALERAQFARQGIEVEIEIETNFNDEILPLFIPRNNLLDSFVNIIRNGMEAMPNGGTLTITTDFKTIDHQSVIELSISDTGVGISAEELPKIFELFFTTKESGLGFGLWRDKIVIEGLGGELRVVTESGKGSTFVIMLPVLGNSAADHENGTPDYDEEE